MDVVNITAHDGICLQETFIMTHRSYSSLWVVLDTLLGRDHPSVHSIAMFVQDLTDWNMDLEDYSPKYWRLSPQFPSMLER